MNRRDFLYSFAFVFGLPTLLAACGSSGGSGYGSSNPTSPATNGGACNTNGSQLETTGTTDGHTHTFQLTATQITAANASAVFTTSNNGHSHSVQLTAAQYQSLQANTAISLNTGAGGTDNHTHSLSISCS